jgi:hypothetical protein
VTEDQVRDRLGVLDRRAVRGEGNFERLNAERRELRAALRALLRGRLPAEQRAVGGAQVGTDFPTPDST